MDFRSFEQNYEVNAFIFDRQKALELKETFFDDLKDSHEISLETWPLRPRIEKIKESFARLISPLL
jgi:cardiolipin synthase